MSRIEIDGKWYEVGGLRTVGDLPNEQLILSEDGRCIGARGALGSAIRHPLTKIDTPIWAKLGKATVGFIKPDVLPLVTGDVRFASPGEWVVNGEGEAIELAQRKMVPMIMLSGPPPEPPKTSEQLLDELERKLNDEVAEANDCSVARVVRQGIREMRERLADTE